MANKFVFDESSQTRMRVMGFAHPWEQLSPEVRVRRRVVGPLQNHVVEGTDTWGSVFGDEFEDLRHAVE
ncbi:MAG: hypothetical protein K0V04_01655 [Deltaproteobacteria bacterium]|nr:hypothetical protein [Deltaproteobacteria bacterium]